MARIELNIRNEVDACIFVPETNTAQKREKFPVLWLLHDYGGNEKDWPRFSRIELFAQNLGIAVICPAGENSYFLDMKTVLDQNTDQKLGVNYSRFITKHLRSALYDTLPLDPNPEKNYIAGVGMGGYGAVNIMLKNPELFGSVISIYGHLDVAQRYAAGEYPHRNGRAIFGRPEEVAGGDNDLMALLSQRGSGKLLLACEASNEFVPELCRRAAAAGRRVDVDTSLPAPGREVMDAYARYIIDYIAADLRGGRA